MLKLLPAVVLSFAALMLTAEPAAAYPQIKKEFDNMYMKEGTPLFKALEGKSSCAVCHPGKDKKVRNAYGMAIDKLLEKDDAKKPEAIMKALKGAAEAPSDGDDSPTFGKLIEMGTLTK